MLQIRAAAIAKHTATQSNKCKYFQISHGPPKRTSNKKSDKLVSEENLTALSTSKCCTKDCISLFSTEQIVDQRVR